MASTPNSGGTKTSPSRAPGAKVLAGALKNNRVAASLITALGARSINAITATSTSQTTDFGSLKVGDFVVHIPFSSGPASPLGNAAGYGILGASAVTNSVGTSIINGSLGIYPGTSITGAFTVSGATNINNAAALAAQTDASNFFNLMQAQALASGTTIPSELGGQTLVPGTYKFASGAATLASTTDGTLTFNGPGTYVIYTASTVTTGPSGGGIPTMAFSGGANLSNTNIYWIVNSSATINQDVVSAGSTFLGNVLAKVTITVTQQSIIDGALIALTGAVTVSDISTINSESTPSGGATSFRTITTAGTLGAAAVVGDLYVDLQPVDLDSNNPLIPPPPAQLTARKTGYNGLDF